MLPEFRQCVAADREWAYALKAEAYREVVERQFGPWNEAFQRELFATRWMPDKSKIILIGGQAVGLFVLRESDEELWLDELQLVREWRGRGLGSRILRDLLTRARAAHKPLRLQVLRQNHRAAALYLRLGFKVIAGTDTHLRMECR